MTKPPSSLWWSYMKTSHLNQSSVYLVNRWSLIWGPLLSWPNECCLNRFDNNLLNKKDCRLFVVQLCLDSTFWLNTSHCRGNDYEQHTKCISEDQKYSGKGYVPKVNKGEAKQDRWIEVSSDHICFWLYINTHWLQLNTDTLFMKDMYSFN